MKRAWNSFLIAFSMYSKIPMPYADWKKENMKYSMCFFPLIGIVLGALVFGWSQLLTLGIFSGMFGTAIYVVLPILVTGGIHFDGFLDTQDALNSHQTIERKLEILKDPHTGAFSIISGIIYFVLAFGIWSEVSVNAVKILAIGFVVSRALSGLSVVTFPLAKNSGLVATFSESAQKKRVKITMVVYLFLCIVLMVWSGGMLGMVAIVTGLLVFWYYHHVCIKEFGGVTGDLAGYFLQVCELSMALTVMLADKLLQGGWT